MLPSSTTRAIREAVAGGFDHQLDFTSALIRQPSPMGKEALAQDMVEAEMRRVGLEIDRFALTLEQLQGRHGYSPPITPYTGLENVVGVHHPDVATGQGGRSLILNGHIDVVPEGPTHRWARDPFSGNVEDGWLYGRGAADMKAGLAAMIAAYSAVRKAGLSPQAPVVLQSVVEEEATGNGTLACVARGYTADFAIIPEASSQTAVDAQVGLMWFDIFVEGEPRHPSLAASGGTNAIEKATFLIGALHELENELNAEKSEHREFANMPRPIVIYIGKISGGDWVSSVPAWCRLEVRVGFYPEMDRDEVATLLIQKIDSWARRDDFLTLFPPRVTPKGQYGEGYILDSRTSSEAMGLLNEHHRDVNGQDLLRVTSGGSSDARILGIDGQTPTVLYGPVGRGYHGYDEAVEVQSLQRITETMALFIADWCGVA